MTASTIFHVLSVGLGLSVAAMVLHASSDQPPRSPKVVDPGATGKAPADAVVLFDGTDLSQWTKRDGSPAGWAIENGELVCTPRTGDIMTRHRFRSAQLHVEFATPHMPDATGQGRGNSGVYVQGRYEIQVLDSFNNETYADGSCGALYRQFAPLVNACRPPKEWQTYDIVFHAPKCDAEMKVVEPGRLTVLHNGVLIHDHIAIKDVCGGELDRNVAEPGPLLLQDHGNLVRFRNLWVRSLE